MLKYTVRSVRSLLNVCSYSKTRQDQLEMSKVTQNRSLDICRCHTNRSPAKPSFSRDNEAQIRYTPKNIIECNLKGHSKWLSM